jgi:hypothetical protein
VGIDIHVHDTYLAVAHGDTAIAVLVIALALFGAAKLIKLLWVTLSSF